MGNWFNESVIIMTIKRPGFCDALYLRGEIDLVHIRDGKVLSWETMSNLVLSRGREYAAKLMNGLHTKPFKYIHIGKGTNTPATTDTHLFAFYKAATADASYLEGYRFMLTHTFTFSEEVAITEAGLCDGPEGPVGGTPRSVMFSRQVFSPRYVIADDNLQVTWRVLAG